MHCFQKLVSDLGTFLHLCVNKIAIEFTLVYEHKDLAFRFWDISCRACNQWGELASIMRKGRNFPKLPMLIPFIDFKLNKRCPSLGMQDLSVHIH